MIVQPTTIKQYEIDVGLLGSRYLNMLGFVSLAQLVERRSHNPEVVSSILTGGILHKKKHFLLCGQVLQPNLARKLSDITLVNF